MYRSIFVLAYGLPEGRNCVLLEPQLPALGLVPRMGSVAGSPPPIFVEEIMSDRVLMKYQCSGWLTIDNQQTLVLVVGRITPPNPKYIYVSIPGNCDYVTLLGRQEHRL